MPAYSERSRTGFERQVGMQIACDAVDIIHPKNVTRIKTGVLVVHATWSATSLLCLGCWRRPLRQVVRDGPWRHVIDEVLVGPDLVLYGKWPEPGQAYGFRDGRVAWKHVGHGMQCNNLTELCRQLVHSGGWHGMDAGLCEQNVESCDLL